MMASKATADVDKNKVVEFQWSARIVEQLISFLKQYKTDVEYKNLDFNAYVVVLCLYLRDRMAGELGMASCLSSTMFVA